MCPESAEEVMFKLKTTQFFSKLLVVPCPTARGGSSFLSGLKSETKMRTGHVKVMRGYLFWALGGKRLTVDWAEWQHGRASHTVQSWRPGNGAGSETQSGPVCFG